MMSDQWPGKERGESLEVSKLQEVWDEEFIGNGGCLKSRSVR
jgi:hypothetical protein